MAGGRELADAPKTRSTANETGNKLHWERGEQGEAHGGEEWSRRWLGEDGDADGGRQSSELLRAAVAAGARRKWSGERERDTRGGSASLKKKPRHAREGAPTTPGRRLRPRDIAGRFRGRGAEVGDALMGGARRSAAAGMRKARRRLCALCWAGAACWAERGGRLALGRAARKGEASWAGRAHRASWATGGSWANRRKGLWAEMKKGGKNEFCIFFQTDFQKHFQMIFDFNSNSSQSQ